MEEAMNLKEAKLTSAAAFVEGGIQEAFDDACSICLENFCDTDPAAVTGCKHEFHLQCVLEWCQRSSQCPMCWQPISLKDPTNQELLDAVVHERNHRLNPPRNAAIFHHPTLGGFELPVGVNDAELEERIMQHLAAAAAMGRARHFTRREGHRNQSSAQGHPHFSVYSAQPDGHGGPASASRGREEGELNAAMSAANPSSPVRVGEQPLHTSPTIQFTQSYLISANGMNQHATPPHSRRSPSEVSPRSQDTEGPSDFHTFSETLKSRLNAVSTRYKESISKSTRGWKERWFSRNSPVADLGSQVSREVNAGIATVSRMIERLETVENPGNNFDSAASSSEGMHAQAAYGSNEQQIRETHIYSSENDTNEASPPEVEHLSESHVEAQFAATSASN